MGNNLRRFKPKYLKVLSRLMVIGFVSSSLVISPVASIADLPVLEVIDGDTIRVDSDSKVRLLQIDTPEIKESECYAIEAKKALETLVLGFEITLEVDPKLSQVDLKNKRITRYVFVGDKNINLELVKMGAATPWFYGGKGIYARELRAAAEEARLNKLGLWGACPGTKLNTSKGVSTGKIVKVSPSPWKSSLDQNLVNAGSYRKESEKGEERLSKNGTKYTCKASKTENRLRWRK